MTHARNTAAAHEARRAQAATERAALTVPAGHVDVDDYIARTIRPAVEALPYFCAPLVAREVGCSPSTLSKWLRGRKRPSQANLDALAAWHERQTARAQGRLPTVMPRAQAPTVIRQPGHQPLALERISPALQVRLRSSARRRNITPLHLAEQILDRHLDRDEE